MAPVKHDGTGKRVRWDLQLGQHMGEKSTKISPKVVIKTRQIITKQAVKIAKRADEHEEFINKVTYSVGVACFGAFCFLLGSRPQDIPYLYCLFFITVAPLRWIYYRMKKWHYFLLDFCYYANFIFVMMLVFFPNNDKLFLICFSFAEGPLAWALIVWRCSLVFSSIDKIVSVLIHLLPGLVFFIIRWWDPSTFSHHSPEDTGPWPAWPLLENDRSLWLWLFVVPLFAYSLWQMLYFLVVNVLRRQRLLRDPEVMTSFRELSRKASRANNVWWCLSGILGDKNRIVMYAVLQALFTVATMSLAVPIFKSYRLHITFECFKVAASVWNGGNFFFDVMPRKMDAKKKRKFAPSENVNGVELPQASTTSIGNGDTKAVMSVESPVLVGPQMRFRGTPVINEQQISASLTNTSSPDFVDPTIHMGDNLVDVGQEIEVNGERNFEEDPASSSVNMGDNLVDVGQEIEVNGERNIEEDPASSSVNTIWARRKASESSGDLG